MADLTSGLVTRFTADAPRRLVIDALDWASPFRGADVTVGDEIVAVGGQPVDTSVTGGAASQFVGQYGETSAFEKAGLKAGDTLAPTLRRRAFPQGWKTVAARAALAEKVGWRNADNRPILGPDGPDVMVSDGFPDSWGGWAEPFQRKINYLLDLDQQTGTFASDYEAKDLAKRHGSRIAYAVEHYPGRWSAAVKADYDRALVNARGEAAVLPPGALDFRRRGEALAAEVRVKGQAGWKEAKAAHAAETIPAFPAPNPVRDDIGPVKGRFVVLPPIGNSGYISDGGHTWFAATGPNAGDGWYFVDAEAAPAQVVLEAQRRYARLVDADLGARWEYLCRLDGGTMLGVVGERAHFGLVAVPVAALVGEAMFVDAGEGASAKPPFAGEEGLLDDTPDVPPPDASPAEVLTAPVGAVKNGNLALWRALHADWQVMRQDDGSLIVYPHVLPPNENRFEDSRRSMMSRVLDARPWWTGDPVIVTDGSRFPGALKIDEVEAWMTHVGQFDGETRTFNDVTVSKRWTLTRIEGGPWRVAGAQLI